MSRFTTTFGPALAGLAMLAASPAALAAEPPQETVRYSAAELATEEGREAVRGRLHAAAEAVCPDARRNIERLRAKRCIDAAMAEAERELERRIAGVERDARIRTALVGG